MAIIDNWPNEVIVPSEDEAIYNLLIALENSLNRIDVQADELMDQRFVDTATDKELQKLGAEVGVKRRTDETIEHFRTRVQIAKGVSQSEGTIKDVAQVLRLIFGEHVSEISIEAVKNEPTTRLIIPNARLDENPLTIDELRNQLLDAVPSGDSIEIVSDDTFILGESSSQGLGNGSLL